MSRMLWFVAGAGVGAWWATYKKVSHYHISAPLVPSSAPVHGTGALEAKCQEAIRNHQLSQSRDWEQERERVRQFSQTAGDTVAELSEATLNTILQATEALKAKMAEHRALREEERRIEEERRRNPPRYV